MMDTQNSAERPKRQRGKPKRYDSDNDDDQNLETIETQSNGATDSSSGDEQGEKPRVKIRLLPAEGAASPLPAGKGKSKRSTMDDGEDLASEYFTRREGVRSSSSEDNDEEDSGEGGEEDSSRLGSLGMATSDDEELEEDGSEANDIDNIMDAEGGDEKELEEDGSEANYMGDNIMDEEGDGEEEVGEESEANAMDDSITDEEGEEKELEEDGSKADDMDNNITDDEGEDEKEVEEDRSEANDTGDVMGEQDDNKQEVRKEEAPNDQEMTVTEQQEEENENPTEEVKSKKEQSSVTSDVDSPNKETGDGNDEEPVTKVRVRVGQNIEDGFCEAVLPLDYHKKEGGSEETAEVAKTGDDELTPAAATTPTADRKEPALDFEVAATPQRKANGAVMCLALGCFKIAQSHSEGFCRTHHNRFLICTGKCQSWDCICGEKIASFQARCGRCHRWRDGKHASSAGKKLKKKAKMSALPGSEAVCGAAAAPANATVTTEVWRCDCGNMVPASKARCGRCHHWRGGRRRGGWKLGSAMGRDYESDDDIDRTQDWKCCGTVISAAQSRCGRCNGWRGGKRIASREPREPREPRRATAAGGVGGPKKQRKSGGGRKKASYGGGEGVLGENKNWQCKNCDFDNFESEITCFICHAMRPNWQWHKRQQEISVGSTATGAALANSALTLAQASSSDPVPASASAAAGQGATADAASSSAHTSRVSAVDSSHIPEVLNYYGTCKDDASYVDISIYYDFNQTYYTNHDYSYLNTGLAVKSGGRSGSLMDGKR